MKITREQYINEVLVMHRSSDCPVLKIYTECYPHNERTANESAEDFIRRCAEQDYEDGEDNLVFPKVLEVIELYQTTS